MVIVGHLVSFIMGKCQRQMRSAWITPASVWSYRFPDSLVIARRQRRDDQGGGEMGIKMHAGEAGKGRGQRANGGKLRAGSVETSKAAGKQDKKCTPARRGRAGASVQTEADCPPSTSRRPRRRRNGIKNARRRDEERQKPACKRRQIAHRQRRDVQGGGESG